MALLDWAQISDWLGRFGYAPENKLLSLITEKSATTLGFFRNLVWKMRKLM